MIYMADFVRVWNWYSRESVQRALLDVGKDREVVSVFKDGSFGKRPDIVNYQADIPQAVAEGTIAFHGSVERWLNPMKLDVGMLKSDLDKLRAGWDILIDPDVPDTDISKLVVKRLVQAFKDHGVANYSVKFSGGKGFHMSIPFESMPEKINLQPISIQYPDMLQKIISYLKSYIQDGLREDLKTFDTPENIARRVGKPLQEIVDENGLAPFKIINMDIFGSRHLFRLPYSLHEKSLLVSMPLKPEHIEKFEKEHALPEKVRVEEKFLKQKVMLHDAENIVVEALDWASKNMAEKHEEIIKPRTLGPMRYIPEEHFPPCIQRILQGMSDGRKRSMFILINFLRNMGWNLDQVEKRMFEWNEKNQPPLRLNYLRGQLRWHFQQDRNLLPPNCDTDNFYKQMGLHPLCEKLHAVGIRNPVTYPLRKMKYNKQYDERKSSHNRKRQQ